MIFVVSIFFLCVLLWLEAVLFAPAVFVSVLACWSVSVAVLPKPKWRVEALLATALGLRVLALFLEPTLSDDIYRYVWEGNLFLEGGKPIL